MIPYSVQCVEFSLSFVYFSRKNGVLTIKLTIYYDFLLKHNKLPEVITYMIFFVMEC